MGEAKFPETGSIGKHGLESCIGVAVVAKKGRPGKIVAHFSPSTFKEQVHVLESLVRDRSGINGAHAFVRMRKSSRFRLRLPEPGLT